MTKIHHFGITPISIKTDWARFEECLRRADCPLYYRPEFCERCDGFYPLCHRVDMRPFNDVKKIGHFVHELVHLT